MQNPKIISSSLSQTIDFARNFASKLKKGSIVTFAGDLGSGKTFICREIIKYLCMKDVDVISPTFNILQIYPAAHCKVYHFDLYRLVNQSELFELGFEEALNDGICLIEWPEIAGELINPQFQIIIDIVDENTRMISCVEQKLNTAFLY